ncbi:MAG TPA: class I SAM-dependent methyltransferase [Tepidisphaeraceae bacterium]
MLRQVNQSYRADFETLVESGLYRAAVNAGQLVAHDVIDAPFADARVGWKVIRPRALNFISYPYEWCFGQLKDAALATLSLQKLSLKHGMSLKDATAFNIQFDAGKPILIDTLSFERYEEGQPWVAYRQMCQHFLAPLALMALRDVRLNQLLVTNLDGVPLDLASALLPASSRLKLGLLVHLHLHAKMHRKHAASTEKPASRQKVGRTQLLGILDSLESGIKSLNWKPGGTEWSDYYQDTNYTDAAMEHKRKLVGEYIDATSPKSVWDLGANTGEFSRLASDRGIPTIAFDIDPAAVEKNYRRVREKGEKNLLPLLMDLTNPSPAIGWNHSERMSLVERGPADLVLALALIHHLAISGNVPLGDIAQFMARVARNLVIEFVPKSDSQVGRLLVVRKDIFSDYTQDAFEAEFGRHFLIVRREPVAGTQRVLYLMSRLADR